MVLLLAVHTASYLLFMWDESSLEPLTEWAYSDWSQRILLHKDGGFVSLLPASAVLIDLISHAWGLHNSFFLSVGRVSQVVVTTAKSPGDKDLKQLAAALGVVVAVATMKTYAVQIGISRSTSLQIITRSMVTCRSSKISLDAFDDTKSRS